MKTPVYRGGNWGLQKISTLPTWLLRAELGFKSNTVFVPKFLTLNHEIILPYRKIVHIINSHLDNISQ